MTSYLDIIWDFVESPERAARAVHDQRPFGLGLLCFLYAGMSFFLAQSLSRRFLFISPGLIPLGIYCIWQVLAGFLLAGILHLVVDIGRHDSRDDAGGNAVGLFVLLGLSDMVWILALPVVLILRLLSLDRGFVLFFVFFALGLLNFTLKARSIKDNYGVSSARAWTVLMVPYVASSLLVIAFTIVAMIGMVLSLIHLFS